MYINETTLGYILLQLARFRRSKGVSIDAFMDNHCSQRLMSLIDEMDNTLPYSGDILLRVAWRLLAEGRVELNTWLAEQKIDYATVLDVHPSKVNTAMANILCEYHWDGDEDE